MVGIHTFPKTPFSDVTEEDLHTARKRSEQLLFQCCCSHLTFSNLIDRADSQRVAKAAAGLEGVAKQWCETIDAIREFWPPFRRNNVGLVIERANVSVDTRITVIMDSRPSVFPTAHEAIERMGQSIISTMNRDGYEGATEGSLASLAGLQQLRKHLAAYPQIDNEKFEWLKSALSIEWRNACDWLAKQQIGRINGSLMFGKTEADLSEAAIRQIEAHEAGPFTGNPKIQPHEEAAVEADRQTAVFLGFDDRATELFIKDRLMGRRQAELIRRNERLKIAAQMNPAALATPDWDADQGELRYGGVVIRKVDRRATNIRLVLASFHELGWPTRVDDPASGGKDQARVNGTVKRMNEGLTAISFHADGSGAGYTWKRTDR